MSLSLTRTLRDGLDRAAARDRRVVSDWIHITLEDAVAASDAKAAETKSKTAVADETKTKAR
jgi:hypothetical protein